MNIINKEIYNNLELLPIDLQGWNGDSNVFGELIKEIKPNHIIEVGTWKGLSAITMCNVIKENNLNTQITCVDTWLGAVEFWDSLNNTNERNLLQKNGYPNIYYQFLSNVVHTNNQDIILPFPNTSRIGYYYFKNKQITADLIYIDASHEYEDVLDDINMYFQILNDGGIIFGDDFVHWQGVQKAVNEFTQKNNLKYEILENNFWIIRK
jgi:hypothetical protein